MSTTNPKPDNDGAMPLGLGCNEGLGPTPTLVERLRSRRDFMSTDRCRWYMTSKPDGDCQDAADEIEKLRARVVGVGAVAINSVSRDQYPLPMVQGVYCCAENPNGLTLVFRRRPNDNDMRNLHELVRAFGA